MYKDHYIEDKEECFTAEFLKMMDESPVEAAHVLSALRGPDYGDLSYEQECKIKARFTWTIRRFVFREEAMQAIGFWPGVGIECSIDEWQKDGHYKAVTYPLRSIEEVSKSALDTCDSATRTNGEYHFYSHIRIACKEIVDFRRRVRDGL